MPNVTNVSTGKPKVAGAVYRAPKGTTLPTNATSTLPSAWAEMGYISEDGVTNSNAPTTEKVKDWSGQVILVLTTEKPDTFDSDGLKRFDFGVGLRGGVRLFDNYRIFVGYDWGLINIAQESGTTVNNRNFYVGASYMF